MPIRPLNMMVAFKTYRDLIKIMIALDGDSSKRVLVSFAFRYVLLKLTERIYSADSQIQYIYEG